jgi:hypothetical protein
MAGTSPAPCRHTPGHDAGYDELYVQQIGPEQDGFVGFYAEKVLPEVRG